MNVNCEDKAEGTNEMCEMCILLCCRGEINTSNESMYNGASL